MTTIAEAIASLRPDAQFVIQGDDFNSITWVREPSTPVTQDEVDAEVARLQAVYEANEYQRLRAAAYPSITDYIDGVVKGDQAQIDAYIAACLAVKAKYPKEQP
jgi:hypothetical protein